MPETGGVPGDAVTLRAENARLRMMLLEDKDAQIAALKTQNAGLAERVAQLERLISGNSGVALRAIYLEEIAITAGGSTATSS